MTDRLRGVRERIEWALARSGREGESVDIVAVTKNVGIPRIEEAVAAGLTLFGENRVQEASGKIPHFEGWDIRWHMIGHLQRNKVKAALSLFSLIHSLDSLKLASEISKRAIATGKSVDLLVQVNTSSEATKFGIRPGEVERLVDQVSELPGLTIKGLMTIGPLTDDMSQVRKAFRTLRRLFDEASRWRTDNIEMCYLSMGMTCDFEIAVEEGSNMVRIGTALFGPREQRGGPK